MSITKKKSIPTPNKKGNMPVSIKPLAASAPGTLTDPSYSNISQFPTTMSDAQQPSAPFHIDFFKQQLRDLAKPNLFRVKFDLTSTKPAALSNKILDELEVYVKTCSFPSYEIGKINFQRSGYSLKIPGDAKYGEVAVTFFADVDQNVRMAFHNWQHLFVYNDLDGIGSGYPVLANKGTVLIEQLDPSFKVVYAVKLHHAWPTNIGEIQLSHDNEHTREEFTVTFAYTYPEIMKA